MSWDACDFMCEMLNTHFKVEGWEDGYLESLHYSQVVVVDGVKLQQANSSLQCRHSHHGRLGNDAVDDDVVVVVVVDDDDDPDPEVNFVGLGSPGKLKKKKKRGEASWKGVVECARRTWRECCLWN
jgi:hypothetical protein